VTSGGNNFNDYPDLYTFFISMEHHASLPHTMDAPACAAHQLLKWRWTHQPIYSHNANITKNKR